MVKEFYMLGKQKVDAKWFCGLVKAYNHSEKGKATRAKYVAKNRKKYILYIRAYSKKRRADSLAKGLCPHCHKNKRGAVFQICSQCREKRSKYWRAAR